MLAYLEGNSKYNFKIESSLRLLSVQLLLYPLDGRMVTLKLAEKCHEGDLSEPRVFDIESYESLKFQT